MNSSNEFNLKNLQVINVPILADIHKRQSPPKRELNSHSNLSTVSSTEKKIPTKESENSEKEAIAKDFQFYSQLQDAMHFENFDSIFLSSEFVNENF